MTLDPDQITLTGLTIAERRADDRKQALHARHRLWASALDAGPLTVAELAAVWWPGSRGWGARRPAGSVWQAQQRVDDLCRLGHVLPPFAGWHRDTVPWRATPEAGAAMLAPVDGRARVVDLAETWWGRTDVTAVVAAWRRLQWLRARRLIARLPVAYYPERRGAYVPRREGA